MPPLFLRGEDLTGVTISGVRLLRADSKEGGREEGRWGREGGGEGAREE